MAPDEAKPSFGRRLRRLLRTYRSSLSVLTLAVGVLFTTLAFGDFTPLAHSPPFPAIDGATDQSANGGVNYNLVFVVAGPIIVIIGAYLVGAYYLARRKFEHLMLTKSKAEFLRNLPDVEDLLWDLTPADEQRYLDKKAELRIRR